MFPVKLHVFSGIEGRLAIMVSGGGVDSPLQDEGHSAALRGRRESSLWYSAGYDGSGRSPRHFVVADVY